MCCRLEGAQEAAAAAQRAGRDWPPSAMGQPPNQPVKGPSSLFLLSEDNPLRRYTRFIIEWPYPFIRNVQHFKLCRILYKTLTTYLDVQYFKNLSFFQPKLITQFILYSAYIPQNTCMEGMKIECQIHDYVTKSIFYHTSFLNLSPNINIIYNINYLNINPIKLISLKQTLIHINCCPIQQVR